MPKAVYQSGGSDLKYFSTGNKANYWKSVNKDFGSWRDLLESKNGRIRERTFDNTTKTINVTESGPTISKGSIYGEILGKRQIVFHRATKDDSVVSAPPSWWQDNKRGNPNS